MRDVARKMNEKIAELEEEVVEVRHEDKTIRGFIIPARKRSADISSNSARSMSSKSQGDRQKGKDNSEARRAAASVRSEWHRQDHVARGTCHGHAKGELWNPVFASAITARIFPRSI